MSWAFGRGRHPLTGMPRDIGYGVEAVCDLPKCWEDIDRGLSQFCGDQSYGGQFEEERCRGYYCDEHLEIFICEAASEESDDLDGYFCPSCYKRARSRHNRKCAECREAWAVAA